MAMLDQLGSHQSQPSHREFETGKGGKPGEIQQPIRWPFRPNWELPLETTTRKRFSELLALGLGSPKGHALEGRSVDLETGV